MKRLLSRFFLLVVGVVFSIASYGSTIEVDTLVGVRSSSVSVPTLYSNYFSFGDASGTIMSLTPTNTSSPYLYLNSDVDTRKPLMKIHFGSDKYAGPIISTNTRGYCVPINFEATEYFFTFTNGLTSDVSTGIMHVDGKIICEDELKVVEVNAKKVNAKEIDVEFNQAADYVFDEDYDLKPLSEVEAFVKENKHLPGVPSAKEFSEKGMNVSEMSNLLLEKVEELTLHIIQLQKEVELLKARNAELEGK